MPPVRVVCSGRYPDYCKLCTQTLKRRRNASGDITVIARDPVTPLRFGNVIVRAEGVIFAYAITRIP